MNESLVAKALNGAEKYFQPSLGRVRSHEVLDHRKWVFSEVWRIKLNFQQAKSSEQECMRAQLKDPNLQEASS